MNRRAFLATAATLPALLQSCVEEAPAQERDLSIGERIARVDESIRRCVLPDGWTVEEWNGSHIFTFNATDTLTPAVAGYALNLHWRFNQFAGRVYQIDADSLIRDAHLATIDQLVQRVLLDAVERFEREQ